MDSDSDQRPPYIASCDLKLDGRPNGICNAAVPGTGSPHPRNGIFTLSAPHISPTLQLLLPTETTLCVAPLLVEDNCHIRVLAFNSSTSLVCLAGHQPSPTLDYTCQIPAALTEALPLIRAEESVPPLRYDLAAAVSRFAPLPMPPRADDDVPSVTSGASRTHRGATWAVSPCPAPSRPLGRHDPAVDPLIPRPAWQHRVFVPMRAIDYIFRVYGDVSTALGQNSEPSSLWLLYPARAAAATASAGRMQESSGGVNPQRLLVRPFAQRGLGADA
ncbi:hypothetical protein EI94DRAFT_1805515 [Lactarius quietus]|nr:hypothetical protein EI94DRAFT_1805515 [Lactarius quietus]